MSNKSTPVHIKLDERNHVEKPFLDQLAGLGWNILDLEKDQKPGDTGRASFAEVLLEPRLRTQLKVINPWLAEMTHQHPSLPQRCC